METWLIFAIVSVFFTGGYNFMMKMISHRKYNTSLTSIYSYLFGVIFTFIYIFYIGIDKIDYSNLYLIIILAFLNTFFYFLSTLTRIKSLDNIDSAVFFPLYKTFSPIIVLIISLFYFNESLTLKDSLGIIAGIAVPLLLITKTENKIQKNLKYGIILLIITSILASISSGFTKQLTAKNLDISLFVLFSMIFGFVISIISYKFYDIKNDEKNNKNGILKFGLILGFLHFGSFYTFTEAAKGNLAIVYTINSFYILVPIILSVIFYNEDMTYKKAFVIFLSIISMLLFI